MLVKVTLEVGEKFEQRYICTQEPVFVPGFVVLSLQEDKKNAFPTGNITNVKWSFIKEADPSFQSLQDEKRRQKDI